MAKCSISIIVALFNAEKYLPACIESILSQDFTDFELVLIDDGSSDNSKSICEQYAKQDSRISLFTQKNAGVSAARNLGLAKAHGTWTCFVDADDVINTRYLTSFMNNDLSYKQLIIQDIIKENFHNKKQTLLKPCSYGKFYVRNLEKHLCNNEIQLLGFAVCKLYNLELIKKENILFDVNIKYFEDLLFYLRYLSHANSILFIEEGHYIYNIHDESARSKTYTYEHYIKVVDEMAIAVNDLVQFEKWHDCPQLKAMFGMFNFRALTSIYKKSNQYTNNQRISKLAALTSRPDFNFITDYISRRSTKYVELIFIKMLLRNHLRVANLLLSPYFKFYDFLVKSAV